MKDNRELKAAILMAMALGVRMPMGFGGGEWFDHRSYLNSGKPPPPQGFKSWDEFHANRAQEKRDRRNAKRKNHSAN